MPRPFPPYINLINDTAEPFLTFKVCWLVQEATPPIVYKGNSVCAVEGFKGSFIKKTLNAWTC